MATYNPNQNNIVPPVAGSPNPYGYDFWNKMHNSVYYDVPEINDPYCFNFNGQDVRLKVGAYESDPRWLRLALENRAGDEVYEITEHLRDAFGELNWTSRTPGLVPRYATLCKDSYYEGEDIDLFDQLQEKHLCVPIYTPTGRIALQKGFDVQTGKSTSLPVYCFDDVALRQYDRDGVMEYDKSLQEVDAKRQVWPGDERTWALAMDLYFDKQKKKMIGIPGPDAYIGNRDLEARGDVLSCVKNPHQDSEAYAKTDSNEARIMVERREIMGGNASNIDELFERMLWDGIPH